MGVEREGRTEDKKGDGREDRTGGKKGDIRL